MKTFIYFILFACVATCTISCGKSEKEIEAERKAAMEDSLRIVKAERQRVADSIRQKAIDDSVARMKFQSHDMAFFDVFGPVKSIKISGYTYSFNEEGTLLKTSTVDFTHSTSSNYKGVFDPAAKNCDILTIDLGDCTALEFQIESDSKRIKAKHYGCGDYYEYCYYNYNADGELESITTDYEAGFNEETYETIRKKDTDKVKILETDEVGNWIKRKVGRNVEKRLIKYYL